MAANTTQRVLGLTDGELNAAAELSVLDSSGQPVTFFSLFEAQKTIVVLIRHFWCPSCRDYVTKLGQIPLEAFTAAGVRLVVIGCGEPSMIKNYKDSTGLRHDMYADPRRKLYDAIGTHQSFEKAAETPTYGHDTSILGSIRAIWMDPFLKPTVIGKQGKLDQLGADLIIGPGLTYSYARRMRNTQDHTAIPELMALAGVEI